MSERIRGNYDVALYKSTYTLLYFLVYSAVRGQLRSTVATKTVVLYQLSEQFS